MPLMLFVDAAGFSTRDSFIAYLSGSVWSQNRFCLAVVRKSELCSCGCKGAHTLHPIETALAASFRALAIGVWPEARPNKFKENTALGIGHYILPPACIHPSCLPRSATMGDPGNFLQTAFVLLVGASSSWTERSGPS